MRTMRTFTSVLAVAALLAGCQSGAGADSAQTGDESAPADTSESPSIEADASLWPLTGRPLEGGDSSLPALGAKIDNAPQARPQVGLDEADIVFEELVEGGLTRYLAVWHSALPAEVGPVRSVRPMDPDIVSPFGGIIAYSGGQQRFLEAMLDAPVASAINGQSDVEEFFYRSSDKIAPHNVIVRAPELVSYFQDRGAPPPQFNYSTGLAESSAATDGVAANVVRVFFSGSSIPTWKYDQERGLFLRHLTNGAPDNSLSGNQIAAENVVVLEVDIQIIRDIPTSKMVDSGDGVVATGGGVLEVRWSKSAQDAPIELRDTSGARVLLAPGQTWVELIPADGSGVPAGQVELD